MNQQRTALTIADVAKILQVSEKTVTRMLHDGAIPGFKVANQWRFHPDDFERWLDSKRRAQDDPARSGVASMIIGSLESMPLSRLTAENLIIPNLPEAGTKEDVLSALAKPLADQGIIGNRRAFVDGLAARERMMTTGVGGRVALPHLRNPEDQPVERPLVVIGISRTGIDWSAIDGIPVNLFLMPVAGNEVAHVRILAAIRRVLASDDIVDRIVGAESGGGVMSVLIETETMRPERSDRFREEV